MAEIKKMNKLFEDYSVKSVPKEETKSWVSLGLIWAGVAISLGLLLTGGTIGDGLTFKTSILASFIGGGVLAIITILVGIVGAKTNLSTAMISRFTFGERAIILIAFIQALGSYGWFAVQLGLFGKTAATSWNMATGMGANQIIFIVIGGLCMIFTATVGYKAIDLFSKIAVPLVLFLIFGSVWRVMQDHSAADIAVLQGDGQPMTLGMAISIVVSSFIVGAVVAPDISRYAKTPKHTVGAAIFAFLIVTPIVMIIGALMAQATGTWDIVDIMLRLGWGALALIALMLAQWNNNDNNLYSAALGFSVVFKKLTRWQLTAIAGVLGIILAMMGIYENFVSFLIVLGVLIPPMGGVIAVDYYLFNKQHYLTSNLIKLVDFRTMSAVSWIAGSAASFMTGKALFTLTAVPAIDGFLVGAIVHYIGMKLMNSGTSMFKSSAAAEGEQ